MTKILANYWEGRSNHSFESINSRTRE